MCLFLCLHPSGLPFKAYQVIFIISRYGVLGELEQRHHRYQG